MSEMIHRTSLGETAAKNLADVTKTPAQMGSLSPRWLLRMLPWVDVEAGMFRINRVRVVGSEFERVVVRVDGEAAALQPENLRSIPLFRDLADTILQGLVGHFRSVQIPMGAKIFSEGDRGDAMFIICAGKVEVFREGPDGRPAALSVAQQGDFFGEVALLKGAARNASVRALSPVLALRLDKVDFDLLLSQHPTARPLLEKAAAQRTGKEEVKVELTTTGEGEPMVSTTFVDYEERPRELTLSSIMTTLRVHSRIMDLYKQPYDPLREQTRLVIEAMKERQEWELINNAEFGLMRNVVPSLRIPTRLGPPTPDDLDELLSKVWKEPAFFLAHPAAIAAFGRECTRRGVPPPTTSLFGSPFLTWRGIPLVPSDKVEVDYGNAVPTTRILLMRVGDQRRGVVGLHQSNIGDARLPSFAIRFNGVDQLGVANYLVSLYFSLAVLSDDAVGSLDGVELGAYHDYAR